MLARHRRLVQCEPKPPRRHARNPRDTTGGTTGGITGGTTGSSTRNSRIACTAGTFLVARLRSRSRRDEAGLVVHGQIIRAPEARETTRQAYLLARKPVTA